MNLIFVATCDGCTVAINPEHILFVYENTDAEYGTYTVINFGTASLKVKDKFESIVSSLNAWRKKA